MELTKRHSWVGLSGYFLEELTLGGRYTVPQSSRDFGGKPGVKRFEDKAVLPLPLPPVSLAG